jgi:hypothetical protein
MLWENPPRALTRDRYSDLNRKHVTDKGQRCYISINTGSDIVKYEEYVDKIYMFDNTGFKCTSLIFIISF